MLFAELVMREEMQAKDTEPEPNAQIRWEESERSSRKLSEWQTGVRDGLETSRARTEKKERSCG